MASFIYSTNITQGGSVLELASGDVAFVMDTASLASTAASAFVIGKLGIPASSTKLVILGTVVSMSANGISEVPSLSGNHYISVADGASLAAYSSGIALNSGNNTITNSGAINGLLGHGIAINGAAGGNTILNFGEIVSANGSGIALPSVALTTNLISNTGTIAGKVSAISGTNGAETVTNSGTLDGKVFLLAGDDSFDGGAGIQTAQVDGGPGNDTLVGGLWGDYLTGSLNIDEIDGEAGRDTIEGGANGDLLDGGDGRDLLDYKSSTGGVTVDLAGGVALGGHATGDVVDSFEDIRGSGFNDGLSGNSGANRIYGGAGNDGLTGYEGNDRLAGQAGADFLYGGIGRDALIGGTSGDTINYVSIAESSTAAWDRILDFRTTDADKINLSQIDANTSVIGNQSFSFIGSAAFSAAGQLRYTVSSGNLMIYGNVDANLGADFQIQLPDVVSIAATDFFL